MDAFEITFNRINAGRTAILINGTEVGYIEKSTEEEARMIKGTNLRYAKGRPAIRYSYTIARRHFVNAPLTLGSGAYPLRTLGAAKAAAEAELVTLTLKG